MAVANDYRLQQINELQRQLELERAKREKLSANYHKSLKAVDATKSVLVATITGLSTASVVCLSTIVASPAVTAVEAVSLGTAILFVVCGIVRSNLAPRADKHEKIKILADKQLSKISDLVSKALDDHLITDEEYSLVLSEFIKFKDKKEQIRSEAKKNVKNETSLINKFKNKQDVKKLR